MSGDSRRGRFQIPVTRRGRLALLALGVTVLLVAGLFLYDYFQINFWIERDAGRLANYPVVLIQPASDGGPVRSAPRTAIDRILLAEMTRGRNVVAMSRSEVKFNLLHTRAYVKVFLETAFPDQPERTRRLVVVCKFRLGSGGWILDETLEKTLE